MTTAQQEKQETTAPDQEIVCNITSMKSLLGDTSGAPITVPKIGDIVSGTVVSISRNKILVDIGNMCTGIIGGAEIVDSFDTAKGIKVGADVKAVVIGEENEMGQFILSLKRASQETTWDSFVELYKSQQPTAVRIVDANKGGLLIEQDGIRGFIPVSQLTPEHYPRVSGADPEKILSRLKNLIGQEFTVKVINVDFAERRLILSEKAAHATERQKIIDELQVGQTVEGTVSGIVNFGIFVNYKGVEGLVHISEIAWGHVSIPQDYAKVGVKIQVLVIGIEGDKVSFSMKRLTPDPWVESADKYAVGEKVKGVITRLEQFGAFVKLDDEIDGLIHVSELSDKPITNPAEVVSIGDTIEAKVISIDLAEHRLGLTITGLNAPTPVAAEEETEEGMEKKKTKKSKASPEDEIAAESGDLS